MKTKPVRMSYDTYAYLRSLVEDQKKKLEREFQIACNYIPRETPKGDKLTNLDKAHKIFSDQYANLNVILEELRVAAQATYKDHPSKEIIHSIHI